MNNLASLLQNMGMVILIVVVLIVVGTAIMLLKCWRKAEQGKALIRTGPATKVSFTGLTVIPILHRLEIMDISVKRIEIFRHGKDGLICKDNMRADIKVAFFVRVNKTQEDVLKVAQLLGCERASDSQALVEFFDAKFSEALKTVGIRFDFVELYDSRDKLKDQILQIIGTDLNGYVLDDAAIDYLEQTPLEALNPNNTLDAKGIKKITELTATQQELANRIENEKRQIIKKQDNEAEEAILEMDKQLAEAQEKQTREIAEIQSREQAQALIVSQEELKKSEAARIMTEEEIQIAEENKLRQILVAARNKERTDAVELERVERDRMLEVTERERVVTLAEIEKEKVVETERRNIQEVIRERVALERSVVEEQENIKDTEAFATADRAKKVATTDAERDAEAKRVLAVMEATAAREASEEAAKREVIEAEADMKAAEKQAEAKRLMAEAAAAEMAAKGMAEVQVMEAEALALEKHGLAEAKVLKEKAGAEAEGIHAKADAMKQLDGVGKEHEEFKLALEKDLQVELKEIDVRQEIALQNAKVLSEGLKAANIDIIGGESQFFENVVGAISRGESVDRMVNRSEVLTEVKDALLDGEGGSDLVQRVAGYMKESGVELKDVANLGVAAALLRIGDALDDPGKKGTVARTMELVKSLGIGDVKVKSLLGGNGPA